MLVMVGIPVKKPNLTPLPLSKTMLVVVGKPVKKPNQTQQRPVTMLAMVVKKSQQETSLVASAVKSHQIPSRHPHLIQKQTWHERQPQPHPQDDSRVRRRFGLALGLDPVDVVLNFFFEVAWGRG